MCEYKHINNCVCDVKYHEMIITMKKACTIINAIWFISCKEKAHPPYGDCYHRKQSKRDFLWMQVSQTELCRTTRSAHKPTHTPRILDSYQGDSEIRKLKSLFPLSHLTCFLSKHTAGGSTAFEALYEIFWHPLWDTHTSTHTQKKTWQAQPRLTNSNKITLPAKFSSCNLKTLWTAGGPHQTPPESMYKLSHIWICRWPEGIDKECQSKPPLSLRSLCYSDQTVGRLVVPLQLGMTDERQNTHMHTHCRCSQMYMQHNCFYISYKCFFFFAHMYPHRVWALCCEWHCGCMS